LLHPAWTRRALDEALRTHTPPNTPRVVVDFGNALRQHPTICQCTLTALESSGSSSDGGAACVVCCVQDLMKDWGVRSVPQFHFWKNGERVDQMTGSKPDALKTKIAEVAAACVAA
jgi:thioredoxin-related protein